MGAFTLIFVSLLVYLSLKGRLNTYITLATTSSTSKTNIGNRPNEAGKGDSLSPPTITLPRGGSYVPGAKAPTSDSPGYPFLPNGKMLNIPSAPPVNSPIGTGGAYSP